MSRTLPGPAVIRRLLGPALLALVVTLAGCGVPLDDAPRDVGDAPRPPADAPAPVDVGPAVQRLCLVRDGLLVRVARRVPNPPPAAEHLADLLAGPTATESADGLTSALTTATGVTMSLMNARATVEVGDLVAQGARSDQVLAFGQIVCTLGSRLDVGTVSFTSAGQPLGVPRGDGSLADGPLTIVDYAGLMAP